MEKVKGKYKVTYRTSILGDNKVRYFDIEYLADEFIRCLNNPFAFVTYIKKEVL